MAKTTDKYEAILAKKITPQECVNSVLFDYSTNVAVQLNLESYL